MLNQFGAFILLLSGSIVLFTLFMSLLSMSLKSERNLIRSLALELIDKIKNNRSKKSSLEKRYTRFILSAWRPFKIFFLQKSGIKTQSVALDLARQGIYVNTILISVSVTVLAILMGWVDLSNRYVVMNTSSDLPIFYRLTGTWAGSSGSLLFWYFLLTLFSAIIVYQVRNRFHHRTPVLITILTMIQVIFVIMTVFFRDGQPFREFPQAMLSGRGMNALLLHWAMIIHPPILFIGYVAFAIPFALVFSAVISGSMKEDWFSLVRRWTLFSWFFLGVGIFLGSKWAYEELGWGGYWAWDAVENASLMPFILATAFIHSLIVQERRGMFRFWNLILIALTYHFCLLGTWITRSGIVQGPHTFAKSNIGYPLIIFIGLSAIYFFRFIYFKRNRLKPENNLEAVTSKEGGILLNNYLMILSTVIILIGVFSPLIPIDCGFTSAGFACHETQWKETTYNKIMIPIGIFLLFLMGSAPLLAWKKGISYSFNKSFRIPLTLGGVGMFIFMFVPGMLFTREGYIEESPWGSPLVAYFFSTLSVGLALFLVAGIIIEYIRGFRSRAVHHPNENLVQRSLRLLISNKRKYLGYLIHISIMLMFIGFSGGSYKTSSRAFFHYHKMPHVPGTSEVRYYSGDRAYIGDYEITAKDLFLRVAVKGNGNADNPLHFGVSQEGHFDVRKGFQKITSSKPMQGESPYVFANRPAPFFYRMINYLTGINFDGRMITEREYHPQIDPAIGQVVKSAYGVTQRMATSEPDMRSTWSEDLYIQLGDISEPSSGENPDLSHYYEYYYFETKKDPNFYSRYFPPTVVANLEVWINPLVKFIWAGAILFGVSGFLLLIPYGERERT